MTRKSLPPLFKADFLKPVSDIFFQDLELYKGQRAIQEKMAEIVEFVVVDCLVSLFRKASQIKPFQFWFSNQINKENMN